MLYVYFLVIFTTKIIKSNKIVITIITPIIVVIIVKTSFLTSKKSCTTCPNWGVGVVVGGSSIWFWFLSKKFKLSELRRHLLSLQHSVSGRGAAPGLVDSQKNITHVCNGRQWTNERQPRRKGTTTDSQGTRLKGVMAICATQSSTIRLLPFIFVQPSGKNFQFNLLVQNDERNYSQTCLETTCYYSNIWFDGTALQTVALENG